jgi:uncharacterized 2Fe-2S/4Fe-4S cluster protein (DUF4445 family)
MFSADQLRDGWRLACQTAVRGDCVVSIPQSSLFAGLHQILVTATTPTSPHLLPAARKTYVELSPPTLADNAPDVLRLEQTIGQFEPDLALVRQLPEALQRGNYRGTAVLSRGRLIGFEPGDTTSSHYGAAFDIGTTTVVGALLDLRSGDEAAVAARTNPQVAFGDDVLSRIKHAASCVDGLKQLHRAAVEAIGEMIDQMCEEAGVRREHIYDVALAGNTAMEHLFCGIDPAQLGQIPFSPVYGRGLSASAGELGIPVHRGAAAYVFPVVGGFVGGDAVAGMLSTQLAAQPLPTLMVDIGTNGEIVLVNEGRLWAASTAAGPAFEGARISCGMRAASGAIEKVSLNEDVQCGVIGGGPPMGLCGSGLIDLAAELLRHGVVSPEGRMLTPQELPPSLPTALKRRLIHDNDGKIQFLLADRGAAISDPPVVLTQRDVRELQLASGAIRAGISILLKHAGLGPRDLQSVLIAGGFGSFIRRSNAQRIGLLPADVDHHRIHYVGNTSLAGAKWAVLSTEARKQAEELARRTRLVELSMDLDFQREFAEAMVFPAGS